jgi:hypothetical protein
MPKIERHVFIRYAGITYEVNNYCDSDGAAKLDAVYLLEKDLGKMRGGLKKHFKNNPDDIWLVLK